MSETMMSLWSMLGQLPTEANRAWYHVWLVEANNIVVAVCQALAMVVISIGVIKAMAIFLRDVLTPHRSAQAIKESRTELGHSFSLGLGLLIGASILKTTLAPSWSDIGQLAAIIAIRTVLNFFLLYDISLQSRNQDGKPPVRKLFRRVAQAEEAADEATEAADEARNAATEAQRDGAAD